MATREYGYRYNATEKQAYMDFWSQRKPESFALEVWLGKFDIAVAFFGNKKSKDINKYAEFGQFVWRDMAPQPVYGIYPGMRIPKRQMELIERFENRGMSLKLVSGIENRLREMEEFFMAGVEEKYWPIILAGRKLMREDIPFGNLPDCDKYSWLKECRSAKDVAATLWTNFFSTFLKGDEEDSSLYTLNKITTASVFGGSPPFAVEMRFGVVSAPDNSSFGEVVEMAKSCISHIGEGIPRTEKAIAQKVNKFRLKAQAFVEKFPPRPYLQLDHQSFG